jgi:hypothetical protein
VSVKGPVPYCTTFATPCLRCGRMLSFTIDAQKEGNPIVVEKCEDCEGPQ